MESSIALHCVALQGAEQQERLLSWKVDYDYSRVRGFFVQRMVWRKIVVVGSFWGGGGYVLLVR